MRINTPPIWNEENKTVTLQLSDEEWDALERVKFKCMWFILRLMK